MQFVSRDQLIQALRALKTFRLAGSQQGLQHVLPFLALKAKGVNEKKPTEFEEADDFAFWAEFLSARSGDEPYFDPIAGRFRIASHPHSNVATARKGTFQFSWKAGDREIRPEGETWKFSSGYLSILRDKVLTKGGKVGLVPAIPLAAFLFRTRPLPEGSKEGVLADLLRSTFHITDSEYKSLFEEGTVAPAAFGSQPLSGAEVLEAIDQSGVVLQAVEEKTDFQELVLKPNDEYLLKVRQLFLDGYAGVLFVGPPGTSKSWYALQVALALADGEPSRVFKVQFHKSYQYENFIEGFFPNEAGSGFALRPQLVLLACDVARNDPAGTSVILIDELSRSDPGRVFGELLTYMEPSRRGVAFRLASGRETSVPPNLLFLATMNSRDKSVQEIDDAFDRRFGKIEFAPNATILERFLRENRVEAALARRIIAFFSWVNENRYPLGHTFFLSVKDIAGLSRLWDSQLRFVFEKAFKYDPKLRQEIEEHFRQITGAAPLA